MGCCFCCLSCCPFCKPKERKKSSGNKNSKKKNKQTWKTSSNDLVDSSDWEKSENIKSPEKIKDSDLTKELTVPSDKHKDIESCIRDQGYRFGDTIGRGGFGVVSKVIRLSDNKLIACKVIRLSAGDIISRSRRRFQDVKNELFTLVKAKHKNIIHIYDHFIINNDCYIFMEYASGGSLSFQVKKNGPFSEQLSKLYFSQISNAINHLHKHLNIAHKDIKLANILIVDENDRNVIKVTDFGISRVRLDPKIGVIKERNPAGTVAFMSPQILTLYIVNKLDDSWILGKKRAYNPFIADIWALGVCLFIMITKQFPFRANDDPRLLKNMLKNQKCKNYRFPKVIKQKLSKDCVEIIEDMLEPDPHKRLTIDNIICHPWLSDIFTASKLTLSVE